jgi:hypothetical protein
VVLQMTNSVVLTAVKWTARKQHGRVWTGSYGSGWGPVSGSGGRSNKPSGSILTGYFLAS